MLVTVWYCDQNFVTRFYVNLRGGVDLINLSLTSTHIMSSCSCLCSLALHLKTPASGHPIVCLFVRDVQITSVDHASQHLPPQPPLHTQPPNYLHTWYSVLETHLLYTGLEDQAFDDKWCTSGGQDRSQLHEFCPQASLLLLPLHPCHNHIAQIAEFINMFKTPTITEFKFVAESWMGKKQNFKFICYSWHLVEWPIFKNIGVHGASLRSVSPNQIRLVPWVKWPQTGKFGHLHCWSHVVCDQNVHECGGSWCQ